MLRLTTFFVFSYLATACTEVPNSRLPTSADRNTADILVDQIRSLQSLAAHPDDTAELLEATNGLPATSILASHNFQTQLDLPDCLVTTAESATFTDCQLGNHNLDGSLSFPPGRLSANLVHIIAEPHENGVSTVQATLEGRTPHRLRIPHGLRTLNGTLEVSVIWSSKQGDESYDTLARIEELTLDSSGCPTGGVISVISTSSAADATQTFWFGPSCGDLLVAP